MRRNHRPWHGLATYAALHRPPAVWSDPAPPAERETPAPRALAREEYPASDCESLWIDLGGEG